MMTSQFAIFSNPRHLSITWKKEIQNKYFVEFNWELKIVSNISRLHFNQKPLAVCKFSFENLWFSPDYRYMTQENNKQFALFEYKNQMFFCFVCLLFFHHSSSPPLILLWLGDLKFFLFRSICDWKFWCFYVLQSEAEIILSTSEY